MDTVHPLFGDAPQEWGKSRQSLTEEPSGARYMLAGFRALFVIAKALVRPAIDVRPVTVRSGTTELGRRIKDVLCALCF